MEPADGVHGLQTGKPLIPRDCDALIEIDATKASDFYSLGSEGVQVKFGSAEEGEFWAGDYRLVAARAAIAEEAASSTAGQVLWPTDTVGGEQEPRLLPPVGVQHHYCAQARVTVVEGEEDALWWGTPEDLRRKFPAVTDLVLALNQEQPTQPGELRPFLTPASIETLDAHITRDPTRITSRPTRITSRPTRITRTTYSAQSGPQLVSPRVWQASTRIIAEGEQCGGVFVAGAGVGLRRSRRGPIFCRLYRKGIRQCRIAQCKELTISSPDAAAPGRVTDGAPSPVLQQVASLSSEAPGSYELCHWTAAVHITSACTGCRKA